MTEGPKQNTASLSFNTCNPQWCLWRLIFFPLRRPELHTVNVQGTVLKSTCGNLSPVLLPGANMVKLEFSGEKNQTTEIQLAVRFCFCVFTENYGCWDLWKHSSVCFSYASMQTAAQPKAFWLLLDNFQVTWKHTDTLCSLVWHCVNCSSTEPRHYTFRAHIEKPTIHLF